MEAQSAEQPTGFAFVESLAADLSSGSIELPAFPDIVIRIRQSLDDDNCTTETLSKLMGSEPALATRMLQLANSAALRRGPDPISDVGSAVNRLGREVVKSTVMSFAMKQMKESQKLVAAQPYLETTWQDGVNVAAVCYVLAKKFTKLSADEAMLIGLLHGVGKLYILSKAEQYPELFEDADSLTHLLGEWHAVIGGEILTSLSFNEPIAAAVANYQDLQYEHEGDVDFTDILIVAHLISGLLNDEENFELQLAEIPASQYFATSVQDFFEILQESSEHIDSLKHALGT